MIDSADPQNIVELLEARARHLADKPAVHFLADGRTISESVTFGALHAQVLALAASLQRRCPPGGRVLLMLPSQLDYVRAFCACVYAGLIAVPLFAPTSRRQNHLDRVRSVAVDAQPSLILCEAEMRDLLRTWVAERGIGGQVATVAEVLEEGHNAADWQRPQLTGNDVAFLQYTSGSTGTPKGVVVRHRNLVANLRGMQQAATFTEQDRIVSWLPLFHDMGLIGALLGSFHNGMTCYLIPTQVFASAPWLWLVALSQYRGTISFAPNAAYGLCTRTLDEALLRELDLSQWRRAIVGAEPLHLATLTDFSRRFAQVGFRPAAFCPAYGQAEATLCVSADPHSAVPVVVRVSKNALERGKVVLATEKAADTMELVACGYPMLEHQVVIVDPRTLQRCADGEVGEIWHAGPSNADAYWHKEQASIETLQARLADDDAVYVRSGDLGFFHEGQLVVCGRLKDLIILNGHNIYPHDLEFAISDAVPEIRAGRIAAFSVWDEVLGLEKLVVVTELRRPLAAGADAAFYASMRRAAHDAAGCTIDRIVLVELGSIPMTTSGKISRQVAKQKLLEGSLHVIVSDEVSGITESSSITLEDVRTRVAQGEAAEAVCLGYIQQLIQRVRPGAATMPEATLIELGMDSLAIATLQTMLARELGWLPPMADLFGDKDLAGLATAMASELGRVQPAPAMTVTTSHAVAPLSHAQQRLWFLHELDPSSCQHNIVIRIALRGQLDARALERSLDGVMRRHAILRTRYRNGSDRAEQVIEQMSEFELKQHDVSMLPPELQREQIGSYFQVERLTPFDLGNAPVLRAHLFTRASNAHELVLCVHHIAFDGRSAEVFLDELGYFYKGFSSDKLPELPALSLQYGDFAQWEHARIDAAFVNHQLAFWRTYLSDVSTELNLGALPLSTPSPGVHRFLLDLALCRTLEQRAREAKLTLFMTLLSTFAIVLHYVTKQERFLVGTDVSGRWPPGSEDSIGFFVNQLAIRCDHSDIPSLRALFARQRQDAQQAYAHQELPFDILISALALMRSTQRAPLFQVKLNYQPSRIEACKLGEVHVDQVHVHQDRGDFDLVVDLMHGSAGIAAELKYDIGALSTLWAVRFQRLWERLMVELESWLDQPLSMLLGHMQQWDTALQLELGQAEAALSRAQLARIKRRTLSV